MTIALNKRPIVLLSTLFFFALGIRIFYLLELSHNPYFDNILDAFDHYNMDLSAISFAQGDLLARAPNNSFAPLYRYFLGCIYWLFGRNFYIIYSIQFAMGALASVLIFLITRDLFGTRAGLIAFFGFALHTTEIIYEGTILREAFIAFWGVVSFYLLSRLAQHKEERPGIGKLILAALALSFFIQGRPNTILCLPFAFVFLHKYVFHDLDGKTKARNWMVFSCTLFGSFIPLLVQCYLVHGKFVFFDSSGPHTFLSGNLIGYSGVGFDSELIEKYQKKHDLGYAANIRFLIQHIAENPVEFIKMYFRKIFYFFNDFETPTNISVYLYREFSSLLPWLLNHFAFFSALGLVGIVLSVKSEKNLFLLYSYAFALAMSVILFLIEDRYRLPAVPYYIIFSAYTVDSVISWIERHQYRQAGYAILASSILFAVFQDTRGLVRIREHDYNNLASAYQKVNDLEKTNYYLDKALAVNPLAKTTFYNKGLYHFQKKEWEMAIFYLEHLSSENLPGINQNTVVRMRLAYSLAMMGKSAMAGNNFESALNYLERSLKTEPSAENLTYLGICYFNLGKKAEAQTQILQALNMQPEYAPAKAALKVMEDK
jgi:tetratricopeptide (TPR) repeat protein